MTIPLSGPLPSPAATRNSIFDEFTPYTGICEPDIVTTWIGTRLLGEWKSLAPHPVYNRTVPEPRVGEEYFEWVDLLTAVKEAIPQNRFIMLDLGAGTGRWGINAILAAQQKSIGEIDIRFVEAEPRHVQWLNQALSLNNVQGARWTLHDRAISYVGRRVRFTISNGELHAANWYGQYIQEVPSIATDKKYCGHPVFREQDGEREYILVDSITPEEIARDISRVDYIDMDLQGAELGIVENSMPFLDQKVRRVHIGTHGEKTETAIRKQFSDHKWECVWDFAGHRTVQTPYGPVEFQDGVQTWLNPKL